MSTTRLVPISEVASFIKRCMISIGTPEDHASSLADTLVTADYRGHFSHGLNRLGILCITFLFCIIIIIIPEMYVKEVANKLCDPLAKPSIIKETLGTAYVDGHNGIGSVSFYKLLYFLHNNYL